MEVEHGVLVGAVVVTGCKKSTEEERFEIVINKARKMGTFRLAKPTMPVGQR